MLNFKSTIIFGFIFGILMLILHVPLMYFGFLFVLIFGLIVWGVFDIRINYFLKNINQFKLLEKEIILTFDDGPTDFTAETLEILKKHQVKATFFCIGKQIEKHPEIFKKIHQEGHQIGNHSFSHANNLGFYSSNQLEQEILKTKNLIKKEIDLETNIYRPPFGVTNPNIAKAIKRLNQKSIGWSIRSLDTVLKNEHQIFNRIKKKLKSGSIILLHDTSNKSNKTLDLLLYYLKTNNYKVVNLKLS
jgi:peptidoglycan-N-acetylglucosamine deacetylase